MALPSPPDSPTSSARSLPVGPFRPAVLPEIVIPDDASGYRRQNPNWVDPAAPRAPLQPLPLPDEHDPEESGSVVSTILLDDGASIKTIEDDDGTMTDDENDSIIAAALHTSIPLASIFSTPKEHIADVRKAATDVGLHTGLMRRPGARTDGKSSVNQLGERESSWWIVLGRNVEAVRYLVDVQQRGMPGMYVPDKREEVVAASSSSSVGFFHMVLAGAVGGAAVLFGMAGML